MTVLNFIHGLWTITWRVKHTILPLHTVLVPCGTLAQLDSLLGPLEAWEAEAHSDNGRSHSPICVDIQPWPLVWFEKVQVLVDVGDVRILKKCWNSRKLLSHRWQTTAALSNTVTPGCSSGHLWPTPVFKTKPKDPIYLSKWQKIELKINAKYLWLDISQ